MKISRRKFINTSSSFLLSIPMVSLISRDKNKLILDETALFWDEKQKPFYHGVASGDPTENSVIIWTRITLLDDLQPEIEWEISTHNSFRNIVNQNKVSTNKDRDYTIKIDLTSLEPDTYYYYRFRYKGINSIVGRTKTLATGIISESNIVAVSCNAYEGGYFGAYQHIAQRQEKIDAVLHLGDYIYEDFLPKYFEIPDRIPLPQKRCNSMQDYRTRFSQYRLDKNLQKAHQSHPFINIWDDHEIANDAYESGAAENAHSNIIDGNYKERRQNAMKVFFEWLPIRENSKYCYRQFKFGNLAEVFMLDERSQKTQQQAFDSPSFEDSDRQMLGNEQLNWLKDGLSKSTTKWKILGNQVIFSTFDFTPILPFNPKRKADDWSGYPKERKELITYLKEKKLGNTVIVSGDSHCSWAFNLKDNESTESIYLGVEIGVPAISSGNWGDTFGKNKAIKCEEGILNSQQNNHVKFADIRSHGYVFMNIKTEKIKVDWVAVDKFNKKTDAQISKTIIIEEGLNQIK